VEKLAKGINPLDGTQIAKGDLLKNERIAKCMEYVTYILGEVVESGGIHRKINKENLVPFALSEGQLKSIKYPAQPVGIAEFVRVINAVVDEQKMAKLKLTAVQKWLKDNGYLRETTDEKGKHTNRPTQKGESIGMFTEVRDSRQGLYVATLYSRRTMAIIVDHLAEINNEE
jgi:hypothetical protein